jgi:ankyrin repeat protein
MNMVDNDGNTILHICVINDRQSMLARIRKAEIVSELIENKEGRTAKHIENDIK